MAAELRAGAIRPSEILRVLFGMAIVLVAAHYVMFSSGFVFTQGGGDSVLANYVLEHDWRWLIRETPDTSLFSPPVFYPVPDTAGYSDLYAGALPFYGIWRFLGAPPQTAFQFFLLTVSCLNFLSAYLLIRSALHTSAAASFIAATLFAVGSPRMMQMGHVQLVIAFYVVWAMAGLWLMLGERRRVWTGAILFVASVALQVYTAFYYAWFMAFCGTVALVYALSVAAYRKALSNFVRNEWRALAAASVVGAVLLAPAGMLYGGVMKQLGGRSYAEVAHFLPTPLAWIAQGPSHWIYGRLNRTLGIDENFGYQEMFSGIGLATTALVIIGFVKFRSRPMIAIWGVAGAVAIVATLSWHGVSLWRIVYPIFPGASAVRAMGRFGVFLLLPAAMGLAVGIDWLSRRVSPWAAIAGVLLVFAEQAGTFPAIGTYNKNQFQASINGVAQSVGPECKSVLFSWTEGATSVPWMQLIGMWTELSSRVPTLNGYSGQSPPGWPLAEVAIGSRFDRVRLYDGIRAWMLGHAAQIDNVCWITPGAPLPDVIRRQDLAATSFAERRTFLALLGRLPKESDLATAHGAREFMDLPEFRAHEQFAFAAYRALFDRDPSLPLWLSAVEDLESKGKTPARVIADWKSAGECISRPVCANQVPDDLVRAASSELPREEREHDSRVLLYYCLFKRAPSEADPDIR